jgi:acyl-CoA thioester hydrolase
MYTMQIQPRLGNTDCLGHINNCALAQWVETARQPFFNEAIKNPEGIPQSWNLIMAHSDYDYLAQMHFPFPVEVRTYVSKIGHSSFTLTHDMYQKGVHTARCHAVLVYFDFAKAESMPLADELKTLLQKHYKEEE